MTVLGPALEEDTATYVFAVCGHVDHNTLTALPGIGVSFPVRPLPFGALTAVVQHVEAAHFSEDAWRARLSDERELERCARAHHDVVSAAALRGPTIPLPLATLYRSDARASQALRKDAERFRTVLRRIDGRVEWAVKVYAHTPPTPATAPMAEKGRDGSSPRDGRAYLERKRGLQKRREQRHDEALHTAETVDSALRAVAVASRRLRTHAQEPREPARTQVLNAAYLVDEKRGEEVARTVLELRRSTGADIEMSGPWVPYSFVGEVGP
ncbi:GvpL/GvpF family gas vesicle protein [Streptomyces sp. NPDC059096]|uniref:GvpL/GvpF family gas vesicle protein n=1 Tax=Streptomyces sp. NPDC059096 TaxID=3346727 RepID=UPI0036A9A3A7